MNQTDRSLISGTSKTDRSLIHKTKAKNFSLSIFKIFKGRKLLSQFSEFSKRGTLLSQFLDISKEESPLPPNFQNKVIIKHTLSLPSDLMVILLALKTTLYIPHNLYNISIYTKLA